MEYAKGGGEGCNYPTAEFSHARRWYHHLVVWGFALMFDGGRPPLQIVGIVGTGIIGLVICDLFLRPLRPIRRVTTTQGRDIATLMQAINGLDLAHNSLRLILVVCLLVRAAGFVNELGWL